MSNNIDNKREEGTAEEILQKHLGGVVYFDGMEKFINAMKEYAKEQASKGWDAAIKRYSHGVGWSEYVHTDAPLPPDKKTYLKETFK